MPCRTLCHSELVVDCHCLKFHGRFFCSFFLQLLEVRHRFCLYTLYCLHCGNSLTPNKPSKFPSTIGKLSKLSKKRKEAAARKSKAPADAAAAAAAVAAAAASAAADAASCAAAAAAVVPATPSGSGLSSASNKLATCRSYATAVANGAAVAGVTTSVNAATLASPSSVATRSSKKPKLSAAVVIPAAMADPKRDAICLPALDLLTTELKKKSPNKHSCKFAAAVGHGAADGLVPLKPMCPSRCIGKKTSTGKGASSHPVAEDDAHPIIPAEKAPIAKENLQL